jgi:AraC-like DNA-binding protein
LVYIFQMQPLSFPSDVNRSSLNQVLIGSPTNEIGTKRYQLNPQLGKGQVLSGCFDSNFEYAFVQYQESNAFQIKMAHMVDDATIVILFHGLPRSVPEWINDQTLPISVRSTCWTSLQDCTIYQETIKEPCQQLWLFLKKEWLLSEIDLPSLNNVLKYRKAFSHTFTLPISFCQNLIRLFDTLSNNAISPQLYPKTQLFFAVVSFFESLTPSSFEDSPQIGKFIKKQDSARIAQYMNGLLHNLKNADINIESAAKSNGMSPTKFKNLFKTLYNQPFYSYLLEARMTLAIQLLHQGQHSIGQIASLTGFEYSTNFSTAFSKRFGMSPKSYIHLINT